MAEDGIFAGTDKQPPLSQAELRERLSSKSVAILGCGGLGSNCAVLLVRAGVLNLTLVDYDCVEADNLNRQHYFVDQIGVAKVEALSDTLKRIDPRVELRAIHDCLDAESIPRFVAGADAIVEAVDRAETKALIVTTCMREVPHVVLVSASGLAGIGSANDITTVRLGESLWMTGDLVSDIRDGHALAASRVMVAAAHQAHAVVRVLLGLEGA